MIIIRIIFKMANKKVAIIGSHGLYANYGGWDQLVKNLAELKSNNVDYLIFNSADSPIVTNVPYNVVVKRLVFKASGFQGLFYDFQSILYSLFKVDTILLLGVQGIPLIPFTNLLKKINIVSNVGGLEWERPKFGYFSRLYLKICFTLSFRYSSTVILDNPHYKIFQPQKIRSKVSVIPYGGVIDTSLDVTSDLLMKYHFLNEEYFLSISRALEDNMVDELCNCFVNINKKLVLICNFSSSQYGMTVLNKYKEHENIILINGLYNKPELDLIRRKCKAYIHTHTLCGTAPSLVEMIISRRPIISIDIPQNQFTLHNQGLFYTNFTELNNILRDQDDFECYIPSDSICELYRWVKIVNDYEALY